MRETQMDRARQRREDGKIDASAREREQVGWLREFLQQFGLAWQLLWDGRVPFSTKLVPVLALLYLISPIDLVPDALLGVGQVDDLVVLLIGLRMFVSLCPPEIVSEYMKFANPNSRHAERAEDQDPEIIELEARVSSDPWKSATLHPKSTQDSEIEKSSNKDR
jgi:uncharacterized membrane protein YkvA (DUF1232 family)